MVLNTVVPRADIAWAAPAVSSRHRRSLQEHTMGWFSRTDNGFFIATVVPDNDAARVAKYLGVVHGEAIIGANIFRDMFSSVRDVVGVAFDSCHASTPRATALRLA
jgi:Putative heavy-metal-binding